MDETTGRGYLPELNDVNAHWLGSGAMQADNLDAFIAALDQVAVPQDDYFIWLTGEGYFVKALGDYFIGRRGLDATFVRAVAYWHAK